jgi:aerobic-type carbon monoxide dehydrogenase small subunit (CoxS/CutS family)
LVTTRTLLVNGDHHEIDVDSDTPLLWVLRDTLGLTGTKFGCGIGACGACTVHVNGVATRSCTLPIKAALDKSITTIEGLAQSGGRRLQEAWLLEDVAQCGYCQAGQLMSAAQLLAHNRNPSDAQIDAAMAGNICRCGTYQRIRRAIHRVARSRP